MRTRALAAATALTMALTPAATFTAVATAKTKPPKTNRGVHAGQTCSPTTAAPTGFMCVRNRQGRYVLVRIKHTKRHTKTNRGRHLGTTKRHAKTTAWRG